MLIMVIVFKIVPPIHTQINQIIVAQTYLNSILKYLMADLQQISMELISSEISITTISTKIM